MKRVLLSFILLVTYATANAQNTSSCDYEVKGVILDADTKEALPYVAVNVKGTEHFSLTNDSGEFHIKELCTKSNTLVISCLGYGDTTCQHDHHTDQNLSIYLKKESKSLETITITGEKNKEEGTASLAQQIVNVETLSEDLTQSLAAVLSEVEGVTFISTGNNVQLPVIHGLYGNRVLLLNNGLKHGFQNWGTDHAPEIDVASANSVTIVKGAAGVRYGPEALAGAIIVEADPLRLNKPFKAQLGTGYQTNGRGYYVNSKVAQGLEKWSYHLGANYTRIGDRHAPDYSLTNTGKQEASFNAGLRYQLKNLSFKAYYSLVDQDLGLLRSSVAESPSTFVRAINADEPRIIRPFSYDINEPNQTTQHHLGKIEVDWWYADDARLTFRYGKQLNQRQEFDVRRNAELPIIDLDLTTDDFQFEWKHPSWFNLDGLVGLQVFTQNNDNNSGTRTTPYIPNYNTFRFSAFIVENLERNQNTFEAGVRLDYESNDVRGRENNNDLFQDEYSFTNVTASLGYIRQISGNTTLRTNLGMAWRTPNVEELFAFGQHGFKTTYGLLRHDFNEAGELRTTEVSTLDESDVSPEVGYKWINEWQTRKSNSTLTLTAYAHYIENFTYDRPIAVLGTIRGPMPGFVFDQTDGLFLGADLTWQQQWNPSLRGTFGLSYLWSRDVKEDDFLINQPPITTSYQLVWKTKNIWKIESSQISIKPSYTFEQFQAPRTIPPQDLIDGSVTISPESDDFDFKDAPAGYFLMELAWRFKIKQFDASFSVQNLFNARYRDYLNEMRYFADEMGRNFLFTINYTFNSKPN